MVRAAMMDMSERFRFNRFRTLYVQTRQYDPISDDLIDEMQRLAFTVQGGESEDERAAALDSYRNFVMIHMANIRVVAQALSFAKLDSIFGSEKFFQWLKKGLVRDIMAHGDGKSLTTAFNVVTMTEETVLLGQLGFRVLDTQSANEGYLYYNMHEVEDIRTGQKQTLFVNTTRPMRFLNAKQLESGNRFSIQRQ